MSLEVPIARIARLGSSDPAAGRRGRNGCNALAGTLDVPVALMLAAGIAIGTWVGTKAAHRLPTETLRKSVAALLVLVGSAMLLRLATS